MRPARILLLVVALIAGGLAAFLATRGTTPQTVVQTVAVPERTQTQVLVAKTPIGVGQRLDAASVEWQDWPESAVRPEYITVAKTPDAPAKIVGAVARFEIAEGEPILDTKLAHTDQGYLSAVLEPGMRGVSINIAPASASGGFIVPNDRVDVVLTNGGGEQTTTRVVLSDVKVLAIGTRLGQSGKTGAPANPDDPKSQVFTSDAIATLELAPAQAQTLMTASASGKLSLVLRSVADFATGPATRQASASVPADDQQIRIVRFGIATNVAPGSVNQGQATLSAAAYVPPATVVEPPPATVVTDSGAASAPSAPAQVVTPPVGPIQPSIAPTIQ